METIGTSGISARTFVFEGYASDGTGCPAHRYEAADWMGVWSEVLDQSDALTKRFYYRYLLGLAEATPEQRFQVSARGLGFSQLMTDLSSLSQVSLVSALGGIRSYLYSVGDDPDKYGGSEKQVIILEWEDTIGIRIAQAENIYADFTKWSSPEEHNLKKLISRPFQKDSSIFAYGHPRHVAEILLAALAGIKNYDFPKSGNNYLGIVSSRRWNSQAARDMARLYSPDIQSFYQFITSISEDCWARRDTEDPAMMRAEFDQALVFFRKRTEYMNGVYDLRSAFPEILQNLENDIRHMYDDQSIVLC